jgi:hypothetical protein
MSAPLSLASTSHPQHRLIKVHSASISHKKADAPVKKSSIDTELKEAILKAPSAAQWPNNDYVQLLDEGDVTVKPDGTMVGVYRETYKLFNERARNLAEVSLPYNASYQSVKVLRASTIKKDGKIMNVRPEDIRTTSPYSDYPLYDDSQALGFSMPGIENDCVIDYTYREVSRPTLMPGDFWQYWVFNGANPVSLSRFTIHVPISMKVQFKVYNDGSLNSTEYLSQDKKTRTYVYLKKDLKPIEMEPAMPPKNEVRIWMEVSSLNSWQHIARWFWGLARPQMIPDSVIKQTVQTLTSGAQTDTQKAEAIYNYVSNNIRYVGLEFGLSAYKPHSAPEVISNLYGDCKDKAILLITMLNLVGIKAWPVLLDADDKRPVHDQLPTLDNFNHCIAIASVDGKDVWLDATAETCGYGDIPDSVRGTDAFVIKDGAGQFTTIPMYQPSDSGMNSNVIVQLHSDASAAIDSSTTMLGADSQQWRETARSLTPDQRTQLMLSWAQSLSTGAILKSQQFPDGTQKLGPFVVHMSLEAPRLAKETLHFMLVPAAIGLQNSETANPFVKETRVWPIVVDDPSQEHSETLINLPDGYKIEELPQDVNLINPLFEFHRRTVASSDGKSIDIVVTSISRAGSLPPSQYTMVKSYYDDVLRANGDLIVLKKAN